MMMPRALTIEADNTRVLNFTLKRQEEEPPMSANETVIDTGTTELLCSIAAGVATITLNRPEAKNALSPPMSQALQEMLKKCDADHSVRAILITGAGTAFCAGGDVKNMGDRRPKTLTPEERVKEMKQRHRGVGGGIASMSKPTIAALPGAAVGAGLAIALACDIRIAAQSAFLSGGYSKIGLSGDYGVAWLLTRTIGTSMAREMMFTSDRIDAARAEKLGLVNRVVADAELAVGLACAGAADRRRSVGRDPFDEAEPERGGLARLFRRHRPRSRADRAAVGVGEPQGGGARLRREAQAGVQQGVGHTCSPDEAKRNPGYEKTDPAPSTTRRIPVCAEQSGLMDRRVDLLRRGRRIRDARLDPLQHLVCGCCRKLRHEQLRRRIRHGVTDDRRQSAGQVVHQLHIRLGVEIALRGRRQPRRQRRDGDGAGKRSQKLPVRRESRDGRCGARGRTICACPRRSGRSGSPRSRAG